jgi:predicted transcriptional regulator
LEEFENIADLNELTNKIEEFGKKNANSLILLERIDYLLTNFSFEKFVETLYRINDMVSKNKSILLVHLNPSLLDKRQMTIIENELQPLPSKKLDDIEIEDDLYDILRFVSEQNQNNLIVPFKKIRQKFSIAYSTVAIKLKILGDKELIFIKNYGRFKTVHVSEKGKSLLNKKRNSL